MRHVLLVVMARRHRLEVVNGIFGITSRGNRRQLIYLDDQDRARWIDFLADVVDRFDWRCLAYCQMGNHYHLVIRTPRPTLSAGMQRLNGRYAIRFNLRHEVEGHLFERPFRSTHVEDDDYYRELVRYTLLNPVRAGLRSHPADWPFSSYRATAGHSQAPGFLDVAGLLSAFAGARSNEASMRVRFAEFVGAGIAREVVIGRVPGPGPETRREASRRR
jgi:REP element-mobilizing transposase RayT